MKPRIVERLAQSPWVETVYEYSTAQNVSTLTTLLNWTDVGSDYKWVNAILENQDATNNCRLIVDVSHAGTRYNAFRRQFVDVAGGAEGNAELGEPNLHTYIRIQAQTDSPGFATVVIRWALLGVRR